MPPGICSCCRKQGQSHGTEPYACRVCTNSQRHFELKCWDVRCWGVRGLVVAGLGNLMFGVTSGGGNRHPTLGVSGGCFFFNYWFLSEVSLKARTVSALLLVLNAVPAAAQGLPRARCLASTSVQFSSLVVPNCLRPHGLQHARLPCPSPTPRACSNSCPSSP